MHADADSERYDSKERQPDRCDLSPAKQSSDADYADPLPSSG